MEYFVTGGNQKSLAVVLDRHTGHRNAAIGSAAGSPTDMGVLLVVETSFGASNDQATSHIKKIGMSIPLLTIPGVFRGYSSGNGKVYLVGGETNTSETQVIELEAETGNATRKSILPFPAAAMLWRGIISQDSLYLLIDTTKLPYLTSQVGFVIVCFDVETMAIKWQHDHVRIPILMGLPDVGLTDFGKTVFILGDKSDVFLRFSASSGERLTDLTIPWTFDIREIFVADERLSSALVLERRFIRRGVVHDWKVLQISNEDVVQVLEQQGKLPPNAGLMDNGILRVSSFHGMRTTEASSWELEIRMLFDTIKKH